MMKKKNFKWCNFCVFFPAPSLLSVLTLEINMLLMCWLKAAKWWSLTNIVLSSVLLHYTAERKFTVNCKVQLTFMLAGAVQCTSVTSVTWICPRRVRCWATAPGTSRAVPRHQTAITQARSRPSEYCSSCMSSNWWDLVNTVVSFKMFTFVLICTQPLSLQLIGISTY